MRAHYYEDPDTNSIVFYDYRGKQKQRSPAGELFFGGFFFLYIFSLLSAPLFIISVLRGWWTYVISFLCLTAYTYAPLPRRLRVVKEYMFLNVPKYFDSASYRIEGVDRWPELQVMKSVAREGLPSQAAIPLLRSLKVPTRIWLFHPHGMFSSGWGIQAFNPYFPEIEMCISTALYCTPPIVCCTSHCGNPSPVRASTIKKHLQNGKSIAILLGGFEESTIHPNEGDRVYLKNRVGIFKYALQSGAEVVPAFTFGDTMMYKNVQGCWKFRLWLNSLSVPAMIPFGRFPLAWMPQREMSHVVIGPPIPVERVANPTSSQVTHLHARYQEALDQLYERYKKKFYGDAYTARLQIW